MANIIATRKEINKFFSKHGFSKILSGIPQSRLGEIISSLAMKGNQSKTTDFVVINQGFRTTYGNFLSTGKWDEKKVNKKQQEESFQKLVELAQANQSVIYLSIDNTVIEKKPSSHSKHPMGRTGRHYSHLEGEQVLGYYETPEQHVCRMEIREEILSVLTLCTDTQRERFLLHALYDFSYAEVGALCGCLKQAVKLSNLNRWQRSCAFCRKMK